MPTFTLASPAFDRSHERLFVHSLRLADVAGQRREVGGAVGAFFFGMGPFFFALLLAAPDSGAWLTQEVSGAPALRSAGIALDTDRDPGKALKALESAPSHGLTRWLRARALYSMGQSRAALEALGPPKRLTCLDVGQDAPFQARGGLAAQILEGTDPVAAARIRLDLDTPEALDAAQAAFPRKQPERLRTVRRILTEHAGSAPARRIFDELGPKGILARWAAEASLEIAERWLAAHDNPRTLALAEATAPRLEGRLKLTCRVSYVRGKALRKLRQYRKALSMLTLAVKVCRQGGEINLAMRAGLLKAQVLAILRRASALDALHAELRSFAPGHSYLDDVLRLAAEAHRGRASRVRLAKVVRFGGDQTPRAAWALARNALRRSATATAARHLETVLASSHANRDDRERAEYYLGRLKAQTATAAAAAKWEVLAQRPSFYGFVALSRLRKLDAVRAEAVAQTLKAAAKTDASVPLAPALDTHPRAISARLAWAAGFPEWAVAELLALRCERKDLSIAETLTLAAWFRAIGALAQSQHLVRWDRRDILGPLTPAQAPAWRLAYSRAFESEIRAAARTEKLDPWLLMGLAREESTFDPNIVSWAGATGLTQLMPPTAVGAYATVFGGRTLDLERLTEPELNLRLGAHVLREGLDAFGQVEAFALSAYNGGPGLTRRVLASRKMPFEDWAESNPVRENRGYVKRVLTTWAIYRLLETPDHGLPNWPSTVGPGANAR